MKLAREFNGQKLSFHTAARLLWLTDPSCGDPTYYNGKLNGGVGGFIKYRAARP
jgi:hypothetical protein